MDKYERAIEYFEGNIIAEHEPGECDTCDINRTALSALRAQQEQSEGCEYCDGHTNDFQILNSTTDYSGIEIAFHYTGMLRVRYFAGDARLFATTQDVINVPTCPMCGRQLDRPKGEQE
jgi:hypothetical protein